MYPLSFCLSGSVLSSPLILKNGFTDTKFLFDSLLFLFFLSFFWVFGICHLMTSGLHNFLLEIGYLSCLGYFYLMSCISFAALKIFFFRSLILKCLGVDLFEFILLGIYSAVWMYRVMLFIKILDNLGHCFLKYFLCSFSLAFSFYFIFFLLPFLLGLQLSTCWNSW